MPHYQLGFTPEQFDALKSSLASLAAHGSFDANDATFHVLSAGVTNYAPNVGAILADLVDLGYLRRLEDAGGRHRYALVE